MQANLPGVSLFVSWDQFLFDETFIFFIPFWPVLILDGARKVDH